MVGESSRFFIVRTTARQELNAALLIEARTKNVSDGLYSIVIPPDIKGYIILEVKGLHLIYNLIKDIKHVKGRATGSISIEELEKLIITKPVITELKPGDLVEIISGPFKGLKATVVSVNLQRNEVTLNMLESSYKLEATVPGDYVRPVKK
ncbi:MAG: transcription elongation factor Spt5 [Sulfolobales archaeon]|jgi:transcriptional antiterminator NusG